MDRAARIRMGPLGARVSSLIVAAAGQACGGNVAELARLLGASDRTVRAWQGGESQPPAPVLKLLRLLADPKTSGAQAGLLRVEL